MRHLIPVLSLILCFGYIKAQDNPAKTKAPVLKAVKFEQLKSIIQKKDGKLYVVNFWATWCGPCVKELPDFMDVDSRYKSHKNFKMILVSLDNVADLNGTVRSFIQSRNITTDVYLLDDNKRMNMWIPAIDKTWGGVIPATVFYKNGKKLFFMEGQMNKSELEQSIIKHL